MTQPDQDDELDQRERAPGRRRSLLLDRRRRGFGAGFGLPPRRCSAAGRRRGRGAAGALAPLALRHQLELVAAEAGGRSPAANGQPEESLTRHQPKSIPRMPQRGRECQCRQPRLADVLVARPAPSGARSGAAIIARAAPGSPPRRRPAGRARPGRRADATASASRTRSSSPIESTRGPPTAPTLHSMPAAREGRGEELAERALERARSGGAGRRARGRSARLDRGRRRRRSTGRRCDRARCVRALRALSLLADPSPTVGF